MADLIQEEVAGGRGASAEFDSHKGGVRLNEWLQWASVREEGPALSSGFSAHLRRHIRCDRCGKALICSLSELRSHQQSDLCMQASSAASCAAGAEAPSAATLDAPDGLQHDVVMHDSPAVVPTNHLAPGCTFSGLSSADMQAAADRLAAGTDAAGDADTRALGKRSAYVCEKCGGKQYLFTKLDVLRHEAVHRAQEKV